MTLTKDELYAFSFLGALSLMLLAAYGIDRHYSARPDLLCGRDNPTICMTASGEWVRMMTVSDWFALDESTELEATR